MKTFFLLLLVTIGATAQDLPRTFVENRNIPQWVKKEFVSRKMYRDYSLTFQLSPIYLRGDFNGDGRKDWAILIQEKKTLKFGMAIFHGLRAQAMHIQVTILGADNDLNGVGDDIKWANFWRVYPRDKAIDAEDSSVMVPELKGDAIHIEKKKGKRGLIYWDGKKYTWYRIGK
jgi:hypothetical protein